MTQTRFLTYDEIAERVTNYAQKYIDRKNNKNANLNPTTADQKTTAQERYQRIVALINSIDHAKKTENNQHKLNALHDAGLFINFVKWTLDMEKQGNVSLSQKLTFLMWYKAPRWIVDNRLPAELAKDFLTKVELAKTTLVSMEQGVAVNASSLKNL